MKLAQPIRKNFPSKITKPQNTRYHHIAYKQHLVNHSSTPTLHHTIGRTTFTNNVTQSRAETPCVSAFAVLGRIA